MNKAHKEGNDGEENRRWNVTRKKEVVIRLLRGEALDTLSRETGITVSKLQSWHERALKGMETGLKVRAGDPILDENIRLKAKLGELMMENELLKRKPSGTFQLGRWKR